MRSTMFSTSSTNKRQKIDEKKQKLKRTIEKNNQVVRDLLDWNFIKQVKHYLFCMEDLDLFLKETDYFVFAWALEHENIILLNWLFKHVRPENHLLMVSSKDYAYVKQFIHTTLNMDTAIYNKEAATKQAILKLLLSVDAEASTEIQREVNRYGEGGASLCNQQTLTHFKIDLSRLFIASPSSSTLPSSSLVLPPTLKRMN